MAAQHLGYWMEASRDQTPIRREAYVVWCDMPLLRSLIRLARDQFACPFCGSRWRLSRTGGAILHVAESGNVGSVSDSCPSCHAIVHFDTTPASDRAGLRWVSQYLGD